MRITVLSTSLHFLKYCFVTLLFFSFFIQFAYADTTGKRNFSATEITQLLKEGGYVIYMRHAATNREQVDSDRENLQNCNTQRNLSDLGRKQAKMIGKVFKEQNISVGRVLVSPYCRCMETADLAFGKKQIDPLLEFAISKSREETKRLADHLLKLLQQTPEKKNNTIIVAHTANLREAVGIWPKPEAVMHIFLPTGKGFKHIGFIKPDAWEVI